MSIITTFDEKIESAKTCLTIAYKELLIALDEETWGNSDITDDYLDDLHEIAGKVLKLKRKL